MLRKAAPFPTILVTGSNGQVGFELRRSLAPLGAVVAMDRASCDLADIDQLRRVLSDLRPDVVVNAAAYTAVDRAESEPAKAFAVNAAGVGVLAEEVRALGGLLVHFSTDYVFDGRKNGPYVETDVAEPQSVYGKSKLAGEQAIAAAGARALILRTSWVAGQHGQNFAKTMLRIARERDQLRVVADQFGAPTSAALVADITAQLLARRSCYGDPDAFPTGLYHLAAAGETSWHGYAAAVLRHAESMGIALKVRPDQVVPISTAEYSVPAPRPANSRLDTGKLRETFGIYLPPWQQGISCLLDQLLT